MKILLFLIAILLISCYTPTYNIPKDEVYLDSNWSWINNSPNNVVKSLRKITIRVVNYKYRNVDVKIRCSFSDGALFNQIVVPVKSRDDAVFTVPGFSRWDRDIVSCRIVSIR